MRGLLSRSALRTVAAGLVLAVAVSCSSSDAAPPSTPAVIAPSEVTPVVPANGVEAPQFSAVTTDGQNVSGADLWKDGPVVLLFFATWCSVCVNHQSEFSAMAQRYAQVAKVLGVLGDEEEPVIQEYLVQHPVTYPVVVDTQYKLWRDFAVVEPPSMALISKDGYIVKGWPGGAEPAEVQAELDKLLSL